MTTEDVAKLASDHATWFADMVWGVYYEAFVHGYKHGKEGKKR